MSEIKDDEFPSNSRGQRRETARPENRAVVREEARKPLQKVTSNTIVKQKRGFLKSVTDTIFADDTKSVGSYIIYDILLPAAKSMISEMVGGGIEMLLFGERRGSKNIRREGNRSTTSYGEYYEDRNRGGRDRDRPRETSRVSRSRHDFDGLIIKTRGEAELVLDKLIDLTLDYKEATVADLYELTGEVASFTDRKWGWRDLRGTDVIQVRGGYIIDFPKTEFLD